MYELRLDQISNSSSKLLSLHRVMAGQFSLLHICMTEDMYLERRTIVAQMQLRRFFIATATSLKWSEMEMERSTLESTTSIFFQRKTKWHTTSPKQLFRFRTLLDGAMCRGKIKDYYSYSTGSYSYHLSRGSSVFATYLTNSANNFASFIL